MESVVHTCVGMGGVCSGVVGSGVGWLGAWGAWVGGMYLGWYRWGR